MQIEKLQSLGTSENKILDLLRKHGLGNLVIPIDQQIEKVFIDSKGFINESGFLDKLYELMGAEKNEGYFKIQDIEKFCDKVPVLEEWRGFPDWFVEGFEFKLGNDGKFRAFYGSNEEIDDLIIRKVSEEKKFFEKLLGKTIVAKFELRKTLLGKKEQEKLLDLFYDKRLEYTEKMDGLGSLSKEIKDILKEEYWDRMKKSGRKIR